MAGRSEYVMVASVVISETRSVRAWRASAVNLWDTLDQRTKFVARDLFFEEVVNTHACELNTMPPAPLAIAIPRLT